MKSDHSRGKVKFFGQHALHALAHRAGRQTRRVAAQIGLAAGGGRSAVGRKVGVHDQHADFLDGQAQLFGRARSQYPDQVLPHFGAARANLSAAAGVDLHLGLGFVGRAAAQAGIFVAGSHAPAIDLAADPHRRKELLRRPFHLPGAHLGFDLLQTGEQPDALFELLAGGRGRADTQGILAAQRNRVHPQRFGDQVQIAFDGERRLGDAETAERAARGVVGVHGVTVDLGTAHRIRAGRMGGGARHHLFTQAGIGAAVPIELGFDGGQRAVLPRPGLDADEGGVAFGVETQAFFARVENLDRAPGDLGGQRRVHLAGNVLLAAEASPHHRAFDAHSIFGQPQTARHLVAVGVGDLAAHIDRELVVATVARVLPAGGHTDRTLRLQKGMLGHRGPVGALDDHIGGSKASRKVAVAHLDVLEQVAAGPVGVQHRRAGLPGGDRVGHRRQQFILDPKVRKGRMGLVVAVGDDQRDRIPDIAGRVRAAGKGRPVVLDQTMAQLAGNVLLCQHAAHTRQRHGRSTVDAQDPGMRVCAAQRGTVQHASKKVVVGVKGLPGDLGDRIRPRQRPADLGQRFDLFGQRWRRHVAGAHLLGRRLDRVQNRNIARAATVGVLQTMLDLGVAGGRIGIEQGLGLQDEARGAEAALGGTVLDKCLLQRVQRRTDSLLCCRGRLPARRYSFDRRDRSPLCLESRVDARNNAAPVDDHRACPALGFVAADLGACQPQIVAQKLAQKTMRRHFQAVLDAVDSQSQDGHGSLLWVGQQTRARSIAAVSTRRSSTAISSWRYSLDARCLLVRSSACCWAAATAASMAGGPSFGAASSTASLSVARNGIGPAGPTAIVAARARTPVSSRVTRAATPKMGRATPCGRMIRSNALPLWAGQTEKRKAPSSWWGASRFLPGPAKIVSSGCQTLLTSPSTHEQTWTSASKASSPIVPSAAGRAWATLPPSVATLRTWGPPTTLQLSASAVPCCRISGLDSIAAWVTAAPTTTAPPSTATASNPRIAVTSTKAAGAAWVPCWTSKIKSVPPATTWALPAYWWSRDSASSTVAGLW